MVNQRANPFATLSPVVVKGAPSTAELLVELIVATRQVSRQISELPAQIAAAVQTSKPATAITDDERQCLAEIFKAMFPTMSSGVPRCASAREMVAKLKACAPQSRAAEMLEIANPAVDHTKRLGRLLSRADGLVIGDYILTHGRKQRGATNWHLSAAFKPA